MILYKFWRISSVYEKIPSVEFKLICLQEYPMNARTMKRSTNLTAQWAIPTRADCDAIKEHQTTSWMVNGIA